MAPLKRSHYCGQSQDRTGDPTLFRRVLYRLSYLARNPKVSATLTGLEPATSAVTGRRANQLRHKAILNYVCSLARIVTLQKTPNTHQISTS